MTDFNDPTNENTTNVPHSRLHLVWDVLVLQFKLGVDGARDVILVPVSLIAALTGLLIGGDRPDQYLQRVLKFGRRTEHWINLFGYRDLEGTSDELIQPFKERVFEEAGNNPWLRKAGTKLNKSLDSVGDAIKMPPSNKNTKDE